VTGSPIESAVPSRMHSRPEQVTVRATPTVTIQKRVTVKDQPSGGEGAWARSESRCRSALSYRGRHLVISCHFSSPAQVMELASALGHVTVVLKGREDIIADGHHWLIAAEDGSMRRSGGQGTTR
jgi:hypothetical protein